MVVGTHAMEGRNDNDEEELEWEEWEGGKRLEVGPGLGWELGPSTW